MSKKTSKLLFIGYCSFLFACCVSLSCKEKSLKAPDNLIDKEKFENLVIEFQLVQSVLNSYNDTLLAIRLRDSILVHYEINLHQFYDSEKWYHNNIEEYQTILNRAMDILSEEQTRLLEDKNVTILDSTKTKELNRSKSIRREID